MFDRFMVLLNICISCERFKVKHWSWTLITELLFKVVWNSLPHWLYLHGHFFNPVKIILIWDSKISVYMDTKQRDLKIYPVCIYRLPTKPVRKPLSVCCVLLPAVKHHVYSTFIDNPEFTQEKKMAKTDLPTSILALFIVSNTGTYSCEQHKQTDVY